MTPTPPGITRDDLTGETTDQEHRALLGEPEIERVVLEAYGLVVVEQKQLGGEVDLNIWIRTSVRSEFLVKVSAGEPDEALQWQEIVLTRLEQDAPDIPAPRLVPTLSGDTSLTWTGSGDVVVVRLLTWMHGRMLADLPDVPDYLLFGLGAVAGRLTQTLQDLPPELAQGSPHWDIRNARHAVDDALPFVSDDTGRWCVAQLMARFDRIQPHLSGLPSGVVHHDLNDFNVLADRGPDDLLVISGVIDVNDSMFTVRIAELAIAVAYAMLRQEDPLGAANAVVAGFNSVVPLTEEELAVLFPLAGARLCVNATTWTRRTRETHHPYGHERMRHTWPTLHRLTAISAASAEARFRATCALPNSRTDLPERSTTVTAEQPAPVFADDSVLIELDLSPASDFFDDWSWSDPQQVASGLEALLGDRPAHRGFIPHLTASMLRAERRRPDTEEPATIQLGTRVLGKAGEPVATPVAGVVARTGHAGALILEHAGPDGAYWTCWRGLDVVAAAGAGVRAGDTLGTLQAPGQDLGLGASVLLQVLAGPAEFDALPPEWVRPGDLATWRGLAADPARLLGVPEGSARHRLDAEALVSLRDRRLARSQRAYYRQPPNLVRGRGVWLYDEYARGYLDAINNVTHVGHAEPRVAAAASHQIRKLNTNSRFIYDGIATYAERLVATLPAPLEVVFLVCTGSEANDLALRMSRQVTGREDMMVIDGAYHGNTTAVMGISPNRYKGPGGRGGPPTTHEVMRPDSYRGPYGRDDAAAGQKYAADVERVAASLVAQGRPPAAFIAESLMGTAGNIVFPEGYLQGAFAAARGAGALCISDEVQVGVGRLGTHFWGFQAQGVVPDIVTMGKPIGNGQPMAAVVTTREIADAFDDGVKYFNTFGGNPVSCAIGLTVLDIVEQDGLQANALAVGGYFLRSLQALAARHDLIGDVRGHGLYLGIELVSDPATREPAPTLALAVSEAMMQRGVIVYPTGVHDNVLKLKPPMTFSESDVDLFVTILAHVLEDQ